MLWYIVGLSMSAFLFLRLQAPVEKFIAKI
jgi:hypothetical protein